LSEVAGKPEENHAYQGIARVVLRQAARRWPLKHWNLKHFSRVDRLSLRDVAKLLGISSSAVRYMIARGELPGKKVGGGVERVTYIVPTGALLIWLGEDSECDAEGAA
jgi:excisionase family DNA binding protein